MSLGPGDLTKPGDLTFAFQIQIWLKYISQYATDDKTEQSSNSLIPKRWQANT